MLLAETHGKHEAVIRDNEDYLTSTVFGHLRYVTPGPFWQALLEKCRSLRVEGGELAVTEVLGAGQEIARFTKLIAHFWPKCPGLGEPELALCFTGGDQRSLVLLIEVKLWSPKSGEGERDQLKRYLLIADKIQRLTPTVPSDALVLVVYLTPREASCEILASLKEYGDTPETRKRLYRLQWQDIIDAIDQALTLENELGQIILSDVRDFLRARGLQYFRGFRTPLGIESLEGNRDFFDRGVRRFRGFRKASCSETLQVTRGAWTCPQT